MSKEEHCERIINVFGVILVLCNKYEKTTSKAQEQGRNDSWEVIKTCTNKNKRSLYNNIVVTVSYYSSNSKETAVFL